MKVPSYCLPIMPYLTVEGAARLIDFIKTVFGAEEKLVVPREDGSVMHAEFSFGGAAVMLSDADEKNKPFPAGMFLLRDDVDEVHGRALAAGAQSLQEPTNLDYGRSAGFEDAWGNRWWVTKPG